MAKKFDTWVAVAAAVAFVALLAAIGQAKSQLSRLQDELQKVKREVNTKDQELSKAEDALIKASQELQWRRGYPENRPLHNPLVTVVPVAQLNALVRGVAMDVGLVVLSVGKEAGVTPGIEFTVYRGSEFVCNAVVYKIEARWSSARIVKRQMDPRVGDSATNAGTVPAAGDVLNDKSTD